MVTVASVTCLLSLSSWMAATKFRRGPMLSPFSISMLLLLSIFGIRPLLMAHADEWGFYGYRIQSGAQLSAVVGFVSVLSLTVGYFFGVSRPRVHDDVPEASPAVRSLSVRGAAFVAIGCSLVWVFAMILIGGGVDFIAQIFRGRSAAVTMILNGVPVVFSAIPVAGFAYLGSTFARRAEQQEPTVVEFSWLFVGAFSALLPPLALGNRRLIIPVLIILGLVIFRRRWNARIPMSAVVLSVLAALVAAAIPFVRSAGSRSASASLVGSLEAFFRENGISRTLESFFLSYDTEMFSYIALVGPRLGESLPYGLGRGTVLELVLQPLPASYAPTVTWSNELLTRLFGGGCASAACPVPSLPGQLYFDGGFALLVPVLLFVGFRMSTFDASILTASGPRLTSLLALAGFMPGLIRGNPVSQLWILVNVVVIVLILHFCTRTLRAPLK